MASRIEYEVEVTRDLGLGQFRDNVWILREAIDYLQQFDLVRPPLVPPK